jgi:hypothetical protein
VQHKPAETCVGAALTEGGGGGGIPAQFWQGGGFPTVDIGQVQKGEAEESGACFWRGRNGARGKGCSVEL